MSTKIYEERFAGVKVARINRRSSQHSFTNKHTKSMIQDKKVSIEARIYIFALLRLHVDLLLLFQTFAIHVKPRPTMYAPDATTTLDHPLRSGNKIHSAPVTSDIPMFTKSNTPFPQIITSNDITVQNPNSYMNLEVSQVKNASNNF